MLIPRTIQRLIYLSKWEPPAGIFRMIAFADDGTVKVTLRCGLLRESVLLCPCCTTDGVYAELDALAAALKSAAALPGPAGVIVAVLGGTAGAESEPERRLAAKLELGMDAFQEGLKRATKGGK